MEPKEDYSQFDLSIEEKEKVVAEVIRYILFKTHQSNGCPIKREELTQIVTRNYPYRTLPASVITECRRKLRDIFGYEMKELQRSRRPSGNHGHSTQKSVADAKTYVLMSELPAHLYKKYVIDVNAAHLTGFTFVIVSIVDLAGGKISEENLWHHLKRMGMEDNEENHPVLGNVKQCLESLVLQRYLQKDKISGPEGNTIMYELAGRALDGPISQQIKEYTMQIVNKNDGDIDDD